MTVKDAAITLCFLGSILLAILGGWNYMKGRILHYEQKMKIEKMQVTAQPFLSAEEELEKINKEKNNALIMFAGGVAGFFLVISYINRRRRNKPVQPNYKTNQS